MIVGTVTKSIDTKWSGHDFRERFARSAGPSAVSMEIRKLNRKMSRENPLWGVPRIHGELLKLGIDVGETSVSKYGPPSKATLADRVELSMSRTVGSFSDARQLRFRV